MQPRGSLSTPRQIENYRSGDESNKLSSDIESLYLLSTVENERL